MRHRQAEITDAEWLGEWEKKVLGQPVAHGPTWATRRHRTDSKTGPFGVFEVVKGSVLWATSLLLFGIAAVVALVLAVGWPNLLNAQSW